MKKSFSIIAFFVAAGLAVLPTTSTGASTTWTGATNSLWSNAGNWTAGVPSSMPASNFDVIMLGPGNTTNTADFFHYFLSTLQFPGGAPSFTIHIKNVEITGAGITNDSGLTQTLFVDPGHDQGAVLFFSNTATAANVHIINEGGQTLGGGGPNTGGSTTFEGMSTAGQATIDNNAAAVSPLGSDFAISGKTFFRGSSTAGSATINNNGGAVVGAGGGSTQFFDSSSAGSATINNNAATATNASAGRTFFNDITKAGSATINNYGAGVTGSFPNGFTDFTESSNAESAIINNNGGTGPGTLGGTTQFDTNATAANATITNNGGTAAGAFGGATSFGSGATAGNATITNNGGTGGGLGGRTRFFGTGSGGTARMINNAGGIFDISASTGVEIGSIEGAGDFFLGGQNLTVGNNDLSTTVSGVIQDGGPNNTDTGGSLTKVGAGTLTLSGANTYTGDTNIDAGTLIVDGSTTSANTFANAGGLLMGTGTIGGNLINSGTVAPGHSPGTLNVSGNYTQNSGGNLQIEIGGRISGEFDLLAMGGSASLNGHLQLVRLNNFQLQMGDKIVFLTAAAGVNGTFSSVDNPFATGQLLDARVVYEANDVALEFALGSFNIGGLTPNEEAVADGLNSAANDPRAAGLIAFLETEPLGNLPHDYDLIAPEELASLYEISISQAVVQNNNLQRRMDDIRAGSNGFCAEGFQMRETQGFSKGSDGKTIIDKNPAPYMQPAPDNRWGVFVTGFGEFVDVGNEDFNARGFEITNAGFTLGVDYRVCDNFAIGLNAGYAHSWADLVDRGRVTVDGGKIGAYATWFSGGFHVDGAISGGFNDYDTVRTGLQDLPVRGSTNGAELNGLFAIGYDFRFGCLNVGPIMTVQYTYVNIDGFTETGSLAPLEIQDQAEDSVRGTLGLRAAYDWKAGNGIIIRPEVRAAWQHEYDERGYPIDARFASGAGDVFTVRGPDIGRNSALVGGGVAVQWNNRISTYVYYDGVLGRENYESHNISGGLRVSF